MLKRISTNIFRKLCPLTPDTNVRLNGQTFSVVSIKPFFIVILLLLFKFSQDNYSNFNILKHFRWEPVTCSKSVRF